MIERKIKIGILLLLGLFVYQSVAAQHTLGGIVGYGMASGRFEPKQESRARWGMYSGGLTWRYYGSQRVVGGFGVDMEFVQQGFSYATNSSQVDDKKEYLYYTRHINSVALPIVWQPHIYLARNHVRIYLEAAATFFYNISSSYQNEEARAQGKADWRGEYPMRLARDNRWGYGLAGGAGFAILIKRFEINFRARYYFGYADILRNRNRYADNATDGSENPFWATPLRSPLDNMTISIGLNYRFNKEGFNSWKPRPKRDKNREVFKFAL